MKKHARKLSLHRETVTRLGTSDLGQIAGGTNTAHTSLACVEVTGCDCDTNGCYPYTACFGSCSCAGTMDRTC